MRSTDFLARVVQAVRPQLPVEWQGFETDGFGSLVKLYYGDPAVHFEVWVQGKTSRVEVGLHLEADQATNDRLMAYFAGRFIEVQAALGPRIELDEWTRTWGRLHEMLPFTVLDEALAERVARRLVQMIVVLQPMLAEAPLRLLPA
ncbi:MAG: hypothetical protein FJZ89_06690 [Chloroflexi bacterium]|nr:hypothetical protein [Chloroflexota bacterium]